MFILKFLQIRVFFSTSKEYFTQVIIDIVQSSNPEVSEEAIKQQIEARFIDENVQFTTDYDTVFNKQMIQVYKILVFSPDEKKLSEIRALYQQDETLAVTSSAKINLEINHIDAQKGKAIENYAHSKGIDMQDVLAIGDNDNDISMLKKRQEKPLSWKMPRMKSNSMLILSLRKMMNMASHMLFRKL